MYPTGWKRVQNASIENFKREILPVPICKYCDQNNFPVNKPYF